MSMASIAETVKLWSQMADLRVGQLPGDQGLQTGAGPGFADWDQGLQTGAPGRNGFSHREYHLISDSDAINAGSIQASLFGEMKPNECNQCICLAHRYVASL